MTRAAIGSERLVAFTDGVVAVVITVLVLELKPPHGANLASVAPLASTFLSFVLSFVYVAIYWNNHHHLFRLAPHVDGGVMWANLALLFWVSLIPFATAWMDEHPLAAVPVAVYSAVLLGCGFSWRVLQSAIIRLQGPRSRLREAVGRDVKGRLSVLFYLAAVLAAFVAPPICYVLFVGVAAMWLIPDRRMESHIRAAAEDAPVSGSAAS